MSHHQGQGRPLGESSMQALRLMAKTGFMCRETWDRFFASESRSWKYGQLAQLKNQRYIKHHPNIELQNIFILDKSGSDLLFKDKVIPVQPPYMNMIAHDRVVMQSLYRLCELGIVHEWKSEAELKRESARNFSLKIMNGKIKLPDATAQVVIQEKPRNLAIEYERERKSFSRYREILFAYSGLSIFSMILYVCETKAIKEAIQNTLAKMGSSTLSSRVGFVNANEWKQNPEKALIQIKNGTILLEKICQQAITINTNNYQDT